ncbi:MAG TPA: hypothetical protein VNR37_03500 [Microbacteriaceae bacterium]|nr:hypothetical protein [Microbacteriaceae bacterium]
MVDIEWNTKQLAALAKSMQADRDGRALRKQMNAQFDSITEDLRDRLYRGVSSLPGVGSYSRDLAESVQFKTKLIGGKNARVSIVGTGKTAKGKTRETGKLLEAGYLYHPAWGYWRSSPPPASLRQQVPAGPRMVTDALSRSEPNVRSEILYVLNDYLDRLTEIRKA